MSKEFQKKIRIKFVKKIQKKQSLSKKFRNIKSSKSLSQFFLKNRGNVCQKKIQKPVEKFFLEKFETKIRQKNQIEKKLTKNKLQMVGCMVRALHVAPAAR